MVLSIISSNTDHMKAATKDTWRRVFLRPLALAESFHDVILSILSPRYVAASMRLAAAPCGMAGLELWFWDCEGGLEVPVGTGY